MTHSTEIQPLNAVSLETAATLLRAGEVVAVPSETVYGLAASAWSSTAADRIYAAKGRPSHNPLIVHVPAQAATLEALEALGLIQKARMSAAARQSAKQLIARFWPGPLTIVLPKGHRVPDRVSGGLDTVALRMPNHPDFLALIERAGPLAAPSANRSNRISPTEAQHVWDELEGRIPLILDGGACQVGVESTIVSVEMDGSLKLLREGGLPIEALELAYAKSGAEQPVSAPGMLREHYAPETSMLLLPAQEALPSSHAKLWVEAQRIHVVRLKQPDEVPAAWREALTNKSLTVTTLSADGSDRDAAQKLFATLRAIDAQKPDLILVEAPDQNDGLWPAIRDRLTRAAARWM